MAILEERKKCSWEELLYAARNFGKAGTRSDHPTVPKEQQLSIDLENRESFGVIGRILKWIENVFKYFLPRYNLFTEVGTRERKVIGTNTKVKYFIRREQNEHALYIGEENKDLKLYSLEGKLYDTRGKISKTMKDCVAYVMTLDGRLIVHEHINVGKIEYSYRHSTLAGGKPVLCSGLIKIVDGKIAYIDNNSGHYKPKQANLYNAIKKLEGLFLQDAKVTYLGSLELLRKQIPIIRRIPHKKELVRKFLEKMEKKGKDGLTKYQRHFARVKKCNDQYIQQHEYTPQFRQKLLLKLLENYKPVRILGTDDNKMKKMVIEHSIREIIGAGYGHKPAIDFICDGQKNITAASITFRSKDNRGRLIEILDLKGLSYLVQSKKEGEYTVSMARDNMDQFIKNTLQINIDSIESLNQQKIVGS